MKRRHLYICYSSKNPVRPKTIEGLDIISWQKLEGGYWAKIEFDPGVLGKLKQGQLVEANFGSPQLIRAFMWSYESPAVLLP